MKAVTDAEFYSEVNAYQGLVVVDFWAPWCGPCRLMMPNLEQVQPEFPTIKFIKVNIDDNTVTPASLNVRGIPALVAFKDGQQVWLKAGAKPVSTLRQIFTELLTV